MALQGDYEPSKQAWVREQVELYESTGGKEGNVLPGTDDKVVVITSVGAKSGKLRKNPVMRVEKDGVYAAVASKGGAATNPDWHDNFVAHPLVDLQDGPVAKPYRARLTAGEERRAWWEHAVATWPTYAEYEAKTDREIPVFVLEPVGD